MCVRSISHYWNVTFPGLCYLCVVTCYWAAFHFRIPEVSGCAISLRTLKRSNFVTYYLLANRRFEQKQFPLPPLMFYVVTDPSNSVFLCYTDHPLFDCISYLFPYSIN